LFRLILEVTYWSRRGDKGMYSVHDWAEVHRLHHVEGMSKAAIAVKLSMSRNTVARLVGSSVPPHYQRAPAGSQVDRFAEAIAAMLDEDATVPATVIAQRLRPLGFTGSLTILKDHLRRVRPTFAAARAYQRTSYEPGELAQTDWWDPGVCVPVGRGQSREVFGLVTGLPFSAGFRVVFAFNKTVAAFCPAMVGGLTRLGGLPKVMVSDNDACIVASRRAGVVTLVAEVAALYGHLGLKSVPLRPYFPEGKGFIERMNQFLETSFLPLRNFDSITDLQHQVDQWLVQVADRRRVRRIDAVVADALAVERGWLRPAPSRWPDVDQRLEVRASSDAFVRVGDVDYSVPPRFARRRLAVRASLEQVTVFCDGEQVAAHDRSWARADVVLAPAHARELREAREAQRRLAAGDIEVAAPNLPCYDELTGGRR
jgi:transposase